MTAERDFPQGCWQGTYTAKTPGGSFHDKIDLKLAGEQFEITYYDKQTVRSAAKGSFLLSANKITFHSIAERFGSAPWHHVASSFTFTLKQDGDSLHLQATDHLGVEKTIQISRKE